MDGRIKTRPAGPETSQSPSALCKVNFMEVQFTYIKGTISRGSLVSLDK